MSLTELSSPSPHVWLVAERAAAGTDSDAKSVDARQAIELAYMRELQAISTHLIQENAGGLYDAILDAALRLLHSDMATIQLYEPGRDGLKLLTSRGFEPKNILLFDWVERDAGTSCAQALRTGSRTVIPDMESCDYVVGTPAHDALRVCEIRAAQSTKENAP